MDRVQTGRLKHLMNQYLGKRDFRIGDTVTHAHGIENNCLYPIYYAPAGVAEIQQCANISLNTSIPVQSDYVIQRGDMAIALTPEEVKSIFQSKLRESHRAKCQEQLSDFLSDVVSPEIAEERYGMPPDEMRQDVGLLDDILARFENNVRRAEVPLRQAADAVFVVDDSALSMTPYKRYPIKYCFSKKDSKKEKLL